MGQESGHAIAGFSAPSSHAASKILAGAMISSKPWDPLPILFKMLTKFISLWLQD